MRTAFFSLIAIFTSLNSHAQGTGWGMILLSNVGSPANRRVYVTPDAATPPQSGVPTDNRYSIAIYWSENGSPWMQIGSAGDFLTGAGAGQFTLGRRTFTGL